MRKVSTPQDHHHWHLLAEASERQRRDSEARAVQARADSRPEFKPGSPAAKRFEKLMADFVALARKCDLIEAEVERREAIMASRNLEFAADAIADQPTGPHRIKDNGSDNGNGDRLAKALEAIEARLSKLEGGTPPALDEDEDLDEVAEIARRKRTDAGDTPLVTAPEKPSATALDSTRRMLLSEAQSRVDSVCREWGSQAEPPMSGERVRGYRERLLQPWLKYSPDWKNADLSRLDKQTFAVAESQVLAAAKAAARSPTVAPGHLFKRTKTVDGHTITEWHGSPSVWLHSGRPRNYVKHLANVGELRKADIGRRHAGALIDLPVAAKSNAQWHPAARVAIECHVVREAGLNFEASEPTPKRLVGLWDGSDASSLERWRCGRSHLRRRCSSFEAVEGLLPPPGWSAAWTSAASPAFTALGLLAVLERGEFIP